MRLHKYQFAPLLSLPLLLTVILSLQACGIRSQQIPDTETNNDHVISIKSFPTEAIVRANGKKIGITPMQISLSKVLSPEWRSSEDYGVDYRLQGDITFEKDGCDELNLAISDRELKTDINVNLNCRNLTTKTGIPEASKTGHQDNLEQRLNKLEKLRKDGTISADEYHQHRSRILNEL